MIDGIYAFGGWFKENNRKIYFGGYFKKKNNTIKGKCIDDLGESSIEGKIDEENNKMDFEKIYHNNKKLTFSLTKSVSYLTESRGLWEGYYINPGDEKKYNVKMSHSLIEISPKL